MRALVTVGSTGFDDLIHSVTDGEILSTLYELGYDHLTIQYGSSQATYDNQIRHISTKSSRTPVIEGYDYKPDLKRDMTESDLIISHAGSGSILESLRLHKRLIIVVNEKLLDNHQDELACALDKHEYLLRSTCRQLSDTLIALKDKRFIPFPESDGSKFTSFLDNEMGFK
ncbi:glycosyltransferase family 1 protein [Umbelopsis sp. PMI_123]|nr:glycosyltransferase family 1 protein [Umbelopsis sp. PMI_123]